jgi:putative RNA 2'-phosphotransferase
MRENSKKMEKKLQKISKYLSFLLRHSPDAIGLKLDSIGWGSIDYIIENTQSPKLDRDLIDIVVETNGKKRFSISPCGKNIRANQGHSIEIDLGLEAIVPPEGLLHGTAERFIESIMDSGLTKQKRHHVHLSESLEVAKAVGARYGRPVVLKIDTKKMTEDGFQFYKSANNVWLVDSVPPKYVAIA